MSIKKTKQSAISPARSCLRCTYPETESQYGVLFDNVGRCDCEERDGVPDTITDSDNNVPF